jgi:hypothetical protein
VRTFKGATHSPAADLGLHPNTRLLVLGKIKSLMLPNMNVNSIAKKSLIESTKRARTKFPRFFGFDNFTT